MGPTTLSAASPLLYVYADPSGRFETVREAAAVPAASRRIVRVIDPTVTDVAPGDHDKVYVADFSDGPEGGDIVVAVMDRRDFERKAVAALPPGRASLVQGLEGPAEDAALGTHDDIIVYGTRWCGACKQTAAFLTERGIPHIEKDVESDPAAAAELRAKARGAGISADRVPIIDVRGEALVVGFDPVRLSTLIGDPT